MASKKAKAAKRVQLAADRVKRQAAARSAARVRRRRFVGFLAQQEMRQAYCKYGHLGCSDRPGGRCLDEMLTQHPELAEVTG